MDSIDERNKKEKMAKSIIKRRNVVYGQFQNTVQANLPTSETATDAKEEEK